MPLGIWTRFPRPWLVLESCRPLIISKSVVGCAFLACSQLGFSANHQNSAVRCVSWVIAGLFWLPDVWAGSVPILYATMGLSYDPFGNDYRCSTTSCVRELRPLPLVFGSFFPHGMYRLPAYTHKRCAWVPCTTYAGASSPDMQWRDAVRFHYILLTTTFDLNNPPSDCLPRVGFISSDRTSQSWTTSNSTVVLPLLRTPKIPLPCWWLLILL